MSEARKRKNRRLKQAKEEAQQEIEKYRTEREVAFKVQINTGTKRMMAFKVEIQEIE